MLAQPESSTDGRRMTSELGVISPLRCLALQVLHAQLGIEKD